MFLVNDGSGLTREERGVLASRAVSPRVAAVEAIIWAHLPDADPAEVECAASRIACWRADAWPCADYSPSAGYRAFPREPESLFLNLKAAARGAAHTSEAQRACAVALLTMEG